MNIFRVVFGVAIASSFLAGCDGQNSSLAGQPAIIQSKQFLRSDKAAVASDYQAVVQELYVAYFGRPADPGGLANFEAALLAANAPTDIQSLNSAYATNPAIQTLVNSFQSSAEAIALYSSGTTTAFVTAIYQNVLGRAPDTAGLNFWVNAISTGALTQGDAALSIMAGGLTNTSAQGLLDAQLIANRLAVASYFTAQVSNQGAVNAYAGTAAADSARSLLGAVTATTNATAYQATVNATVNILIGNANVTGTPPGFAHPGVLVNLAQLNYIKSQVAAGNQPFLSAYNTAVASIWGSLSYAVQGPPANGVIECGSNSNPDLGCSAEDSDASAAYTQALLWYISGNAAYANNAIAIMNAYAKGLTGGHTDSNGPLQSAWTSEKWPAAAEIIRYTYTGWAAADVTAFANMLTTQYLPFINANQGAGVNGNWELSMIDGMMGIAVFTNNTALYNQAIALWKQWIPAYFYNYALDGSQAVTFAGGPTSSSTGGFGWSGQTVFNAATSGVSQETCRDMKHAQYGVAATFNAAETAYLQGTDLYTPNQARMTTTLEYQAGLLMGGNYSSAPIPVPVGYPDLCTNALTPNTYNSVLAGTMERAYNAYHNRMGIALPNTLAYLVNEVRPNGAKTTGSGIVANDQHNGIWETLTHAGNP